MGSSRQRLSEASWCVSSDVLRGAAMTKPIGGKPQYRDYWDESGTIYFTGGKAYGLSRSLRTICLGKEGKVLERLKEEKERRAQRC